MPNILAYLCSFSWLRGGSSRQKDDQSRDLISRILEAHRTLVGLDNLSPGEVTNKTLGGLVDLCIEQHDSVTIKKVLTNRRIVPILRSLRQISSDSECCLERHWNGHIVSRARDAREALELLTSFPYYQNYVELARLELHALYAVRPSLPRRIAFLGSGPLPLTSMCLLQSLRNNSGHLFDNNDTSSPAAAVKDESISFKDEEGLDDDDDEVVEKKPSSTSTSSTSSTWPIVVANIDHDARALTASAALCEKLGAWSEGMVFQCSDAAGGPLEDDDNDDDLGRYDVVFLAALVGVTQREKEDIVVSVARRMRAGALLVVRSAHGLRTLLYPEVDLSSKRICEHLQVETVTHPYGKVVNSVIVARVKEVAS